MKGNGGVCRRFHAQGFVAKMTTSDPSAFIVRGQVLSFRDDPFATGSDAATAYQSDGAFVVEGGKISVAGPAQDILASHPQLPVERYTDDLIMAGFVDSHVHYPQYEVIASYAGDLLEWLDTYTFPFESRFADREYARKIADLFLDRCLANGTTSASVYATVHPQSAETFFAAAEARGLCMTAGKVMMDRNAPDNLRDTVQSSYDDSKALMEEWHGRGRLQYAITPRFAITSTPGQLEAAGTLWREYPSALMQTHIDESRNEIAEVRRLFPDARDYLDVYERFCLAGPGSNFGHAIHLTERERDAFAATGSGISHCPTSNMFLGSGLMDLGQLRGGANPVALGLATDIGGGSSLSMFRTMKAAYEVARLCGYGLHPAHAYYLATLGGAQLLRQADHIGNIAAGYDADFIVVDLRSTPEIANRMEHVSDLAEMLFVQMMLADDRAIRATYVAGRKLYQRSGAHEH
jgi:guanine deaminase